ncbi:MAG: AAA family ATPase [Methyloversatilis sp.]|jgi:hypothetical protein|nr:AAA family ATPase [Methyloversatilis sp.]
MAHLHPQHPGPRLDSGYYRELDVIRRLQDGLDGGFDIFHSLTLHTLRDGADEHREIDVVVLGPAGDMVLLEIKAGQLSLNNGELLKLYAGRTHDAARQSRIQFAAMVNKLKQAGLHARVLNCLVLPDFCIGSDQIASFARERIFDADMFDRLPELVRGLMPADPDNSPREDIRRFLSDEFRVSPDLRALGVQLRDTTHRLSDGLATWVPRIESPSGVIRVDATAGSGKTQLALRLLEEAAARKQRALYVCFNRALADHIVGLAPATVEVGTFHERCVEHYRRVVGEPDFADASVFQAIAERYHADAPSMPPRYELLVIDEGQDFQPAWLESLLPQLTGQGRLYLMEDPSQRLYEREEFDLDGAVTLRCDDNFRTPRHIIGVINALALTARPVSACSPYAGELPDFLTYGGSAELMRKTVEAVQALLERGIPLNDIAVLTGHGLKHSQLLSLDRIGPWRTRRFTGRYNRNGTPLWTDGELLIDSIFRFKGQSRAGIVLTELDFEELTQAEKRKLFVGLTRCHLAAHVVLSGDAEHAVVREIG